MLINFVFFWTVNASAITSGLVSYWNADGNANDSVDGNHGTPENGATFALGLFGQAFSFDGIDDVVRVPDSPNLNFGTGDFTFAAWGKLNDASFADDRYILIKGAITGFPPVIQLWWHFPRLSFSLTETPGAGGVAEATGLTRDGAWHHYVGVRRGTTTELYYDGQLVASGVLDPLASGDVIGDLGIGGSPVFGNIWPGLVDDVRIYNRALTECEIKELYGNPCSIQVAIDIKPGSNQNPINLRSNGVLPVAIFSTNDFDALSVDEETILFADPDAEGGIAVPPIRSVVEDVDGDGLVDLLLFFSVPDLEFFGSLDESSEGAVLVGETFDGNSIVGGDFVRIVPPKGRGKSGK